MTLTIPIPELDEALQIFVARYFNLEQDTALSSLVDSAVGKLRKGAIQFSEQQIHIPAVGELQIVGNTPRTIGLHLETKWQKQAEKHLSQYPFVRYTNVTEELPKESCFLSWFHKKTQVIKYDIIIDLDAIPGAKPKLDLYSLALRNIHLNADELTISASLNR